MKRPVVRTIELVTKECRRIRRLFNAGKISFFVFCLVTLYQNLGMFITEFSVIGLFLLKESGGDTRGRTRSRQRQDPRDIL